MLNLQMTNFLKKLYSYFNIGINVFKVNISSKLYTNYKFGINKGMYLEIYLSP